MIAPNNRRRIAVGTLLCFAQALLQPNLQPNASAQSRPGRRPIQTPAEEDESDGSDEGTSSDRAPTGGVNRRTGFELELHGTLVTQRGRPVVLRGTAFEVRGLATLRPLSGAHITVFELDQRGHRLPQALGETTAAEAGRFQLSVTPEGASIMLVIREGRKEREWPLSVTFTPATRVNLLTDRVLYEPGETINAWLRVVDNASEVPMARKTVEWTVGGTSGTARLGQSRTATSEAGVAAMRVNIPSSAPNGSIPVTALIDGTPHTLSVLVGRRTVERVFATMTIDQHVVQPGNRVTGNVTVRTPSGAPVQGAAVQLTMNSRDAGALRTDAEGIARFSVSAPTYLRESISSVSIFARINHPAYGAIGTTGAFTLARVPFEVEAQVANGALVPEVPQNMFLTLTDPVGEPPPARTGVTVEGPAVAGGRFHGTTDAHGMLTVPMRLPRNAAARHESGPCEGRTATSFDVVVESQIPLAARLCESANTSATVVPRVLSASVLAGARLDVAVERSPAVRGKSVSVELLHGGIDGRQAHAVLATAIAGPSDGRVSMNIPQGYLGAIFVRARPIGADGAAEGTGALDSVMVRPAHVFDLAISADKELYHVRETAHLTVQTPAGIQGGHIAFVARDLAAHGGERGWNLAWLNNAFSDALEDTTSSDGDRLVRSALAAHLELDTDPQRAAPLVAPSVPQEESSDDGSGREGDLRDPFVLRDELVRRGIGQIMMAIENSVENAIGNPEVHHVIAPGGRGFDPTVVHQLITAGQLDSDSTRTLGGDEITIAMLQAADPSFTFEHVARRVTRKRLVGLLASVASFAEGSRSARTEPQERWLSRIAGNNPGMLRDPWGNAFALRRVAPGTEAIAMHTRLSGWELVSPGPDRAVGTGDDVKNPFDRAVPTGTVYAVASGEDALMAALAALDPGQEVLNRIIAAYGRLADAATEENTGDVAEASASESLAPSVASRSMAFGGLAQADDMGGIGAMGYGSGGGGSGMGYGRASRSPSVRGAPAMENARAEPLHMSGQFFGARSAALATLVRERFPATLKVLDEQALDPSGRTVLDLPLADALTTYRVEAIAWTREGWTTSKSFELRVDQDAIVDAPVPPFTVVGDVIRLPLRLQNRTRNTLNARLTVTAEGDFGIEGTPSGVVEVPARDGNETIVEVRMTRAGRGSLVIAAIDASTGTALDAARRPIEVLAPARPVRTAIEALLDGRAEMTLDLPADAVYRAQGVLRLSRAEVLFGDPRVWLEQQPGEIWPAWVLALQNERPTSFGSNRSFYSTERLTAFARSSDSPSAARAISALWLAPEINDTLLRSLLEVMGRQQEGFDRALRLRRNSGGSGSFFATELCIQLLISLAPAIANQNTRPALRELLNTIVSQARIVVENETTVETNPLIFARAAAALTLSGPANNARVQEFLRRAARGEEDEFGVDDEAGSENLLGFFVPDPRDGGERVEALAAYGIARLREGNRDAAFQTLRSLARRSPNVNQWNPLARALAMALATKITAPLSAPSSAPVSTETQATAPATSVRVMLDGRSIEVPIVQGVGVLLARELSTAGRHRISLEVARGTVLVAQAEGRYGRPWTVQPIPRGPIAMTLEGETGARDTRAAYVLRLQNRSARVISSPLIEIDVPAGVELDQETRQALASRVAAPPLLTGRTLALRLRSLSPGGFVRLPLPLRWSVGGTLNGLGVAAYAGAGLNAGVTILEPKQITIEDHGREPDRPDLRTPAQRQTQATPEVAR